MKAELFQLQTCLHFCGLVSNFPLFPLFPSLRMLHHELRPNPLCTHPDIPSVCQKTGEKEEKVEYERNTQIPPSLGKGRRFGAEWPLPSPPPSLCHPQTSLWILILPTYCRPKHSHWLHIRCVCIRSQFHWISKGLELYAVF